MALDAVKNFAKVTLSAGYAAGATSVVLSSGDGAKLPQPSIDGAFNLVWWDWTDYGDPADDPNVEIVRCTARSTDTLTITRAQEGTADANHNTGGKTYKGILSPTKKLIDDTNNHVFATDSVKQNQVIRTDTDTETETLINKSLTEPKLTGQSMIAASSGNEGKLNYANDANRKAVGGCALEVITKSPNDANYYREILSNRQDCMKHNEVITY